MKSQTVLNVVGIVLDNAQKQINLLFNEIQDTKKIHDSLNKMKGKAEFAELFSKESNNLFFSINSLYDKVNLLKDIMELGDRMLKEKAKEAMNNEKRI